MKTISPLKSKIGIRLVSYFLIAGLIPLCFFLFFFSNEYKNDYFNSAAKELKKNVHIISSKIFEDLITVKTELNSIASMLSFRYNILKINDNEMRKYLDTILIDFNKFENLAVYSYPANKLICTTDNKENIINYDTVNLELKGAVYIKYFENNDSSALQLSEIHLYTPVHYKNEIVMVISGKLKKEYLWEVTKSIYQTETSDLFVFDADRQILIKSFFSENADLLLKNSIFAKMNQTSGIIIEEDDVLGKLVVCYYQIYMKGQFGLDNWTVVIFHPAADIFSSLDKIEKTLKIASVLSILFLLLMALILSRRIVNPIIELVKGAKEITVGNFEYIISNISSDEIGELSQAFNEMSLNLLKTTISKNYFFSIINSMNDMVFVVDLNFKIENVNRQINKIGYSVEKIIGKSIELFFDKNDFVLFQLKCREFILTKNKNIECDSFFKMSAAEKIPVNIQFSTLDDTGGKIIVVSRDIREQKKITDENRQLFKDLQESYKQLKDTYIQLIQSEKLAAIGTLTAGITHEISTPITYIKWNMNSFKKYINTFADFINYSIVMEEDINSVKLLKKKYSDKKINFVISEATTTLTEINEGIDKIIYIIKNLKLYSHPGFAGLTKCDVNQIIKTVISIAANNYKDRINIVTDFGALPEINCESQPLSQAFMNLILNAAQSIKDKGSIQITTVFNKAENNIVIKIKDDGIGIAKENQAKIFDPFFTTKEVGKGVGLGLSIVYKIINKLKGSINVESELNKGACFIIIIPLQ